MRVTLLGVLMIVGCGGGAASSSTPTTVEQEREPELSAVQLTVDLAGGGTDATEYQQVVGPNVAGAAWTDEGPSVDDVDCASAEGLGWCLDDDRLYACSGGTWRSTSCFEVFEDGACGVVVDLQQASPGVVDCGHRGEMLPDPMEAEYGE